MCKYSKLIPIIFFFIFLIINSFAKPITIKVWYPDELGVKPKYVDKAAEDFRKAFPDVNLEVTRYKIPSGDFLTKLLLAIDAKEAPDVFHVGGTLMPEFVEAKYIRPLTPYVVKWEDWQYYPKSIKDAVRYKGHYYTIPYGLDVRWLYYRKDIFAKAGLPTDWKPKGWDDILNTAQKIKNSVPNVIPFVIYAGVAGGGGTVNHGYIPLLYGTKALAYDIKSGKYVIDTSAVKKVLEFYKKAFIDLKLVPQEVLTLPKPWTTMREKLGAGELAILFEGGWVYGGWVTKYGLENVEKTVGYTLMPSEKGTPYFTVGGLGTCWYISSQSKNPDLAWEFIKRFNTRDIVAKINIEDPHPVARLDSAELPEFKAIKYLYDCTQILNQAKFEPMAPGISKFGNRVQLMTGRVASGEMSVDSALKKFIEEMKADFGDVIIK